MYINTVGGRIDVGAAIGKNISIATLVGSSQNLGDFTEPGRNYLPSPRDNPSVMSSVSSLPFGEWFEVNPQNVKLRRVLPFVADVFWVLPDGSEIKLDSEEVVIELWGGIFASVQSARVKLTRNTYRGLAAYGHVARDIAVSEIPQPAPTEPSVSTAGAVAKASTAIIILALVGAAIWFLPKNIAR